GPERIKCSLPIPKCRNSCDSRSGTTQRSASRAIGTATIERCLRTSYERKDHCTPAVGLVGSIRLPCGRTIYCCSVCSLVLATDERVVLGADALPIPSPDSNTHHCSFLKNRCGHDARSWFLATIEADAWHVASQLWD